MVVVAAAVVVVGGVGVGVAKSVSAADLESVVAAKSNINTSPAA